MLLILFIIFQVAMILFFSTAFFTKQELLWALAVLLSATLIYSSFNVEIYAYQFNATSSAYVPVMESQSYPYIAYLNIGFFVLAIILMIFDIFDKYGRKQAVGK